MVTNSTAALAARIHGATRVDLDAGHDLNLAAAFCDRLYVLQHGRIVASGTPAEVLTVELLREVFGVEALIDTHPLSGYPRITWITQP